MGIVIKGCGGEAAVQMPAPAIAAVPLDLGQPMNVREEQGRTNPEPIPTGISDLAALIAGITGENRHEAVGTGSPTGQEAW